MHEAERKSANAIRQSIANRRQPRRVTHCLSLGRALRSYNRPSPMRLSPGARLGPYEILAPIGAGGMGEVYRARDQRLRRDVAIKLLPPSLSSNAERLQRFEQEAQAAGSLNHPNIVTVYDVDVAGDISFIVMEYVAGRTLGDVIGSRGMQVVDALKSAVQIADALATAHAAGIVHRDLKPANVMITDKGLVKVLDFGLAKLTAPADADQQGATEAMTVEHAPRTEEGTILGTVAYMSPEQADGRTVDARSDIFSFGSLLYEMVTGRRAFQGQSKVSTLAAILNAEPGPASQIAAGVPPELDRIIEHCLRKDPARRFQHLDDVKTLLEGLRETPAPPSAPAADAALNARRRRGFVVAAAALLILSIAAIAWWSRERAGASASRPRLSTGGPASSNAEANRQFENAMQLRKVNFDLPRVRALLERALEIDPHFAEARAWHGFTNWLAIDSGYTNDSALLYSTEEEIRRALQDEPTLARAHTLFAYVYLMQGRKELMPAEIEKALRANPNDIQALFISMHYNIISGAYSEAKRLAQTILEVDPLYFPARMNLGDVLRQEGDVAGAIREQKKILEQDPQSGFAIGLLAWAHLDIGDLQAAREVLERSRPADRQSYALRLISAVLMALEGKRDEAVRAVDADVQKWAALDAIKTHQLAEFYGAVGDHSQALDWLDRAVRSGDERADYFRRDPLLASVRREPRFGQILQSIAYRRQQRKAPR